MIVIVPRNSGNRENPENDSPSEMTHKIKSSQPKFDDIGVITMRKDALSSKVNKDNCKLIRAKS